MRTDTLRERLAGAWSRIPQRERLTFVLLYFEGLTLTEAARALGCSVREVERTVEQRLAKLSKLVTAASKAQRRRVTRGEPRRWAA